MTTQTHRRNIYPTRNAKGDSLDREDTKMTAWEKLENLTEQMGAEAVLDEVARALTTEKLNEVLDFIARNWDVDMEGWEE